MTPLYRLDAPASAIAATFDADAGGDPWTGGYISPGLPAPVIVRDEKTGLRRLRPMFWGVTPPPRGDAPVTTARNLTSPFWIGTLRHAELRCLIPATAFPLWSGSPGARRQHWATVADRPVFAFAAIIRYADELPHFALLTTDPNPMLARFSAAAMPLILHAGDEDRWLTAEWKGDADRLVAPFPAPLMQIGDTPPR